MILRCEQLCILIVFVLTAGNVTGRANAQITWSGSLSNDVTVGGPGGNWNNSAAPGPGDNAVFSLGVNNAPNVPAIGWSASSVYFDSTITSTNFPSGYTLSGDNGALLAIGSNGIGSLDSGDALTPVTVSVPNLQVYGGGTGAYLSGGHSDLYVTGSSLQVGVGSQVGSSFTLYADSSSSGDNGSLHITPSVDFSSNAILRTLHLSAAPGRSIFLNGGITGFFATTPVTVDKNKGGTTVVGGTSTNIGATSVSTGTLQIEGTYSGTTASVASSGTLQVDGTYNGTTTSIATSGTLIVGATGAYTSSGTTTVNSGNLQIDGSYTTPTLTLTSNLAKTISGGGTLTIGADDANNKWINGANALSIPMTISTAKLVFYRGNSGIFTGTNAGGTITVNSNSLVMGLGSTTGAKNFLEAGNANLTINPTVDLSQITVNQPLTVAANSGATVTLQNGITGSGSFTTDVSLNNDPDNGDSLGTVIINGSSTFNGATTVGNGTVLINGAYNGSGTFAVSSGATLGGSGSISKPVDISGTISPAASTGHTAALTVGGLTLEPGASMTWHLGALSTSSPGTNFDQVVINGALALGSAATLSVDLSLLAGGSQPGGGDPFWNSTHTWTIISNTSNPGSSNFASITGGTVATGTFTTSVSSGTLLGDVNGDHVVNGLDIAVVASHWLLTGATLGQGDANGDGTVNGLDIALIASHWLSTGGSGGGILLTYTPSAGSGTAVPEPATFALAGVGVACMLVAKRRR